MENATLPTGDMDQPQSGFLFEFKDSPSIVQLQKQWQEMLSNWTTPYEDVLITSDSEHEFRTMFADYLDELKTRKSVSGWKIGGMFKLSHYKLLGCGPYEVQVKFERKTLSGLPAKSQVSPVPRRYRKSRRLARVWAKSRIGIVIVEFDMIPVDPIYSFNVKVD